MTKKSTVTDSLESDHYGIKSYFYISVIKPFTIYTTIRNMAKVERQSIIAELSNVSQSSAKKANHFCDFLHTVLDKHAPPSGWKVANHYAFLWFESTRDELFKAKII